MDGWMGGWVDGWMDLAPVLTVGPAHSMMYEVRLGS